MLQTLLSLEQFKGRQLEGEWWEPEQPDNKFEGILFIEENNHGKLIIKGPSSVLFPLSLRVGQTPLQTIFGHVTNPYEYKVTLFSPVISRGGALHQDGDHKTEAIFFTNNIIIGEHLVSEDDLIVNGVWVNINGLEEWYDNTGFSANVTNYFPIEKVDISYQTSHSPTYIIGTDRTLRIRSHYSGPLFFSGIKNFKIGEYNFIELLFDKSLSIHDVIREVTIWQLFLTFALRQTTYPGDLRLSIDGREDNSFNISLMVPGWICPSELKSRRKSEILFTFSKLGSRVEAFLRAWREKYEIIEIAIMLFTASYYHEAHAHIDLLMHLQALEVLHRSLFNEDRFGYFPDRETKRSTLQTLRAAIPKNLAETLHTKVYEQINWIGSLTLVDRLKYLYSLYPESIGPLFPKCDDDMTLLKNVRNYLTHYSDRKGFSQDILWSRQLYLLSYKTKLFISICLLGVIGMTDSEIAQLLSGFEHYMALRFESHR